MKKILFLKEDDLLSFTHLSRINGGSNNIYENEMVIIYINGKPVIIKKEQWRNLIITKKPSLARKANNKIWGNKPDVSQIPQEKALQR